MTQVDQQNPLTGRMVLLWLLVFFGVVIGVNLVMVSLALETLPGTEVDSAYRASLRFNAEISAARVQAERGWRVVGHIERAPDGRASIRVEARDRAGAPVSGVAFSTQLARPTDKRGDRLVTLTERESGIYRGEAVGVMAGQWDLIISADRGGDRLFLSRNRVVLQ